MRAFFEAPTIRMMAEKISSSIMQRRLADKKMEIQDNMDTEEGVF
jgi:hypothetical protein